MAGAAAAGVPAPVPAVASRCRACAVRSCRAVDASTEVAVSFPARRCAGLRGCCSGWLAPLCSCRAGGTDIRVEMEKVLRVVPGLYPAESFVLPVPVAGADPVLFELGHEVDVTGRPAGSGN